MRRSSALPISLLALGLTGCVHPTARPVFQSRALASPSMTKLFAFDLASSDLLDQQHQRLYDKIDPERSLFIHDCGTWCGDNAYSFDRWLGMAARIATHDAAEPAAKAQAQWLAGAPAILGENLPDLTLAAVVNRLDLSKPAPGGMWEGAELRFVYAPKVLGLNFRLILEFVLQPMDAPAMLTLAEKWFNLSAVSATSFPNELKKLVTAYGASDFAYARVRTNLNLNGVNYWSFAQWEFHPDIVQQTLLDDQILLDCAQDQTAGTSPGCQKYKNVWDTFPPGRPPDVWHILYPELLDKTAQTSKIPTFGIPGGLSHPTTLAARNVLALQQCTYCHGSETGTPFTHLIDPDQGGTSRQLSHFLVGRKIKPTYAELATLAPGVVWPVHVVFKVAPGSVDSPPPSCAAGNSCEDLMFHDLGRRALDLAGRLIRQEDTKGLARKLPPDEFNEARKRLIAGYASGFVH